MKCSRSLYKHQSLPFPCDSSVQVTSGCCSESLQPEVTGHRLKAPQQGSPCQQHLITSRCVRVLIRTMSNVPPGEGSRGAAFTELQGCCDSKYVAAGKRWFTFYLRNLPFGIRGCDTGLSGGRQAVPLGPRGRWSERSNRSLSARSSGFH